DQVIAQPVLLGGGGRGVINGTHDGPEAVVHFPAGPVVTDGILGHLQSGHGHTAAAGGLGPGGEDLGAEPEELEGFGGGGHVGALHVVAHIVGQNADRILHIQLIFGGTGNDYVGFYLPGLFAWEEISVEAVGVGGDPV